MKRRLAEIAEALSMSTDTLLAMVSRDPAWQDDLEIQAMELAANFRATAHPKSRDLLLRLSRRLAARRSR